MIIGHLATAVIIKHYMREEDMLSLLAGAIFPDVGDKTIKYVQRIYEGRTAFHSLIGFILVALFGKATLPDTIGRSFILGYISHLVCDIRGGVPWFYPFVNYEYRYSPHSYLQKVKRTLTHPKLLESALIMWAFYILLIELKQSVKHTLKSKQG